MRREAGAMRCDSKVLWLVVLDEWGKDGVVGEQKEGSRYQVTARCKPQKAPGGASWHNYSGVQQQIRVATRNTSTPCLYVTLVVSWIAGS